MAHARIISERTNGEKTLTVFLPEGPLVVPGDHPNFDALIASADGGAAPDQIKDQADLSRAVAQKFDALTRRVSVANGVVYFDGDPVHNALAKHIVRALDQGVGFQSLVNFYEKLAANPSEHSREQLYEWLDRRDFTILPDGNFLAYKGCAKAADGTAVSISRGKAIVDGESVEGAVPNPIGAVVEFPRSEVQFDPSVGCARGLHVGDYDYASSWARGVLLTVSVNPADVVSVPTDSNAAKVRVCRYTVEDVYEKPQAIQSAVYEDPDDLSDERYVEDEDDCGDPLCDICNPERF